MSTFGGLMEEYQSISIDRFDGANLNSSVFMLSHNHKGTWSTVTAMLFTRAPCYCGMVEKALELYLAIVCTYIRKYGCILRP